ncbi:Zn(II)2Cys6 transcription factor domain-containing protein [Aspergillus luchuensis]|uniref:Zn(2)-C6 fungal-type domain-containing protein n=1 Tax=Aspergillus kawachii TaxID=1069201 RepID=A0A7R7WAD1_ASPKA|nr:uncharacterized protein AKAW2_40511S [Aspergillus luchuensis]BCR98828.1 hypothetical protein AKAW2_40511S [Aspergillus luchuensis]
MSSNDGKPRQRVYRTRTKSGCTTCKSKSLRRVKCDETRPSCRRCTSTGRKCDGYATNLTSTLTTTILPRPSHTLTGFRYATGARDIRSFQFFYEKTVFSLAGYCGSELWSRSVLQVSQKEKPVWHALVALGALHENFENGQQIPGPWFSRKSHDTFALQQYLAAIRALLRPSEDSGSPSSTYVISSHGATLSVDVCLISCVLFVCYEIMSAHYVAALSHIRSGMKILGEVAYDASTGTYHHPLLRPSTVPNLEIDEIRKLLIRLQIQVYALTRSIEDSPAYSTAQLKCTSNDIIEIPSTFTSLSQARNIYEHYSSTYRHDYHTLIDTQPSTPSSSPTTNPSLAPLIHHYATILTKWSTALDHFEQTRGSTLPTKEQIGLKILQIHRLEYTMMLEQYNSGSSDSTVWDRFNPIFKQIISLSKSVMQMSSPSTSLSSPTTTTTLNPTFSLDLGIIAPLYTTATLCRDPLTRREAVELLRSCSRQEGVFSSQLCAIMAEKVIALEEHVALAAGDVDYARDSAAITGMVLKDGNELQYRSAVITRCWEVPEKARLTYAYPEFDLVGKRVCLTIGQDDRVHVNIPWWPGGVVVFEGEEG